MEIEKKAFVSEVCHLRYWNLPNGDPPWIALLICFEKHKKLPLK